MVAVGKMEGVDVDMAAKVEEVASVTATELFGGVSPVPTGEVGGIDFQPLSISEPMLA